MIRLEEVELRSLDPTTPVPTEPTWVLVRWAGRVLGEVRFPDDEHSEHSTLLATLHAYFPHEIIAEELAASDAAAAPVHTPDHVSIVICTHDRPTHLVACLEAMSELDPQPGQVLVVDNASPTDETKAVADAAGVDYVLAPELGLNRARNVGWRSARHPVVAYVDDDARVDPGFAGAVASAFIDNRVGAVSGLVLPAEIKTPAQEIFERNGGMRKGFTRQLFAPGSVGLQSFRLGVGTNMAFRTDRLEPIGGFDESIGVGTPSRGGGDLDALWRVLQADNDIVYEPNAIVRHFHRETRSGLLAQHRDFGSAYAATLTKRRADTSRRRASTELARWHVSRHVLGPARALRSGDRARMRLLLAEASGSLSWHRRPR